ncbi:uncharacterized protein LOC116260292 isoform X3 [Nymphaea colorata]|uniref:uncharacterized protein LOC116260292 isoform X3 n=1 Tax=Nymphaea colorata TaxID=210225 RepID=UPI00214E7D21|nr:uncharacterized protein LOC116260292 isoform X3 [Nymphaea colorata]
MKLFAWGRGDLGQLGLGDDVGREYPNFVESLLDKSVVHISGSEYHTAFLTGDGDLFMTGSNEYGQLGIGSRESQLLPARVSALDIYRITHVACGQAHTVAVTDLGALVSWGASEFGQLGLKDMIEVVDVIQPRVVRGSQELHFVRVACGAAHTLALTGSGDVYSFGQGIYGALGLSDADDRCTPTHVQELWGLGIIQIACGENHSAALSVDGQVFTWGRGKYGQLGHDSLQSELKPLPVKALSDQMIVQVVCGGNHTMAINEEGILFSWGQGHWGQTGHGVVDDIPLPREVHSLCGSRIIQASAGSRHSIAVTEDWKLYGWGDGEQNQLGHTKRINLLPSLIPNLEREGFSLLYAVAAGEHTVTSFRHHVLDTLRYEGLSTADYTQHENGGSLADEIVQNANQLPIVVQHQDVREEQPFVEPSRLPDGSGTEDMHGKGLRPVVIPYLPKILEDCIKSARILAVHVHAMEDVFSSTRFLILSFKLQPSRWLGTEDSKSTVLLNKLGQDGPGLDILLIRDVYQHILELYNPEVLRRLVSSMHRLLEGIERHMHGVPESRWTRVLLISLQCPLIGEKGPGDALATKLFSIFECISPTVRNTIIEWLEAYPKEVFGGRFIRGVQKYLSSRKNVLGFDGDMPRDVVSAMKVLSILNDANKLTHLVPYTEFYNTTISSNNLLKFWQKELMKWVDVLHDKSRSKLVSLCQVPFLLTPEAKSQILQAEAEIHKQLSVQRAVFQHVFLHAATNPFLILRVRRSNLVADTLRQLSTSHHDEFKKPLKVIFEGEEGVDEGGVRKEFFEILVRDLFNAGYGMFVYNDETRNFWFNANSIDSEHEFWLVGTILGLAIYNGIILDLHLPKVVYKKMMGLNPCLGDLKDLRPDVIKGLLHLLEFTGNVFDTFCLYFQITYDYFGEMRTHDLLPNGRDIPVTNENRQRYVELYVKYLLVDSIAKQFSAFSRAFHEVCGGHALKLFYYEELELLISGLPHYDFDALERVTVYDGGYSRESKVIRWFWELVHKMSLEEKKALLFFTTGNDRAPIGGLGSLPFVIIRNGDDTDRLPTSHTCFNVLMIPEYQTKSKLEDRLKLAISNSIGFGLQ